MLILITKLLSCNDTNVTSSSIWRHIPQKYEQKYQERTNSASVVAVAVNVVVDIDALVVVAEIDALVVFVLVDVVVVVVVDAVVVVVVVRPKSSELNDGLPEWENNWWIRLSVPPPFRSHRRFSHLTLWLRWQDDFWSNATMLVRSVKGAWNLNQNYQLY